MSDVVVSVTESTTAVTVSEQDVAVAITENPVTVSASTVGLQGIPGATGANGTAATITAGTTTVLASTALPTVTNTGTSSAAIFNFGIPAGSAGSNGTNGTSGISGVISVVAPITNTGTSSSAILGLDQTNLAKLDTANTFTVGGHSVTAESTAIIPLIIKGASGQTENLQAWQTSASANLARVSANGSIATAGNLAVGAVSITNLNQFQVTATAATQLGAVIRGAASQTADLQQWQNSGGTVLAKINSSGALGLSSIGQITDGLTAITFAGGRNIQLGSTTPSLGGGSAVIGIANATTVPTSNPTGGGVLYVDTGALKYRGTTGSAATIVDADGTITVGTATYATTSGTATYATTSGTSVSISGSITKSQVSDFTSGTVASATLAGTATYATTSGTATTISGSITESQVTNLVTDLAAKAPITYVYTNTANINNSFPSTTTAISVFGGTATPTFGFTVSADSTYEYEFYGYLQQTGALSTQTPTWSMGSTAITLSPVVAHVTDFGFTSNTTGLTTTATLSKSRITTGQAMTAITTASRYYNVVAKGTIRITGTGTAKIYPALSATVSADNVWSWSAGTLFKLTYVGNGTATAIGTWS